MVDQLKRVPEAKERHAVAPPGQNPPYLWLSGELVRWEDATVHITQVGWPAVSGVFEGIRAYWNEAQQALYVFHLDEHMKRFANSMKVMRLVPDLNPGQIAEGVCDLLQANQVAEDAYCQPLAFPSGVMMGSRAVLERRPEIVITSRPAPSELFSGRAGKACVSSWTRISDNVMPPRIKALSNYQNSRLASNEAALNGYDSPILLNAYGKVAEGPGSCIAIVRDGSVITPPVTASILESITRVAVLELLRDSLGVKAIERDIDRTELYIADEIFFIGTHAEIHPATSVDGYRTGNGEIGPITRRLAETFDRLVRGKDERYLHWLTRVEPGRD
ncbi:MAG: branched-chain-amino-acid transaminase [Dehalococcoidia bacterium]